MEFSPNNHIVKLCLQGMAMEEQNQLEEALRLFTQAWDEATNDFEKFIACYYVARQQKNTSKKIKYYEEALHLALKINDEAVKPAIPLLCEHLAKCYEELDDQDNARKNHDLALSYKDKQLPEKGPFYHGTKADLSVDEFLVAGKNSNYKDEFKMNHIYFTALANGAGLAAELAKGDGRPRVYIVEPMGSFENDPNLTNNKFPGNLTRSYRTELPLKIVGEFTDWTRQTPEEIKKWHERLDNVKGDIIN